MYKRRTFPSAAHLKHGILRRRRVNSDPARLLCARTRYTERHRGLERGWTGSPWRPSVNEICWNGTRPEEFSNGGLTGPRSIRAGESIRRRWSDARHSTGTGRSRHSSSKTSYGPCNCTTCAAVAPAGEGTANAGGRTGPGSSSNTTLCIDRPETAPAPVTADVRPTGSCKSPASWTTSPRSLARTIRPSSSRGASSAVLHLP
jgi:hypothetical protein